MHSTKKITGDLTWVGANDRQISIFENLFPISNGMAYNSYLLQDEKTVLFDTVDQGVFPRFMENVSHTLKGRKLDYLVIHHMEPDHAAGIMGIVKSYPEIKVICTEKTRRFLEQFFDNERVISFYVVKENDRLSIGKRTLRFIMAPMVHWPEVMVTYDEVGKVLFSADAFGSFGALDGAIFADEVNFEKDYMDEMRRYYINIVGKYGAQTQALLKKVAPLEINMICPLHGFVWRNNLERLISKHHLWSSYTPESKGVVIVYGSIYGNTENAAEILACKLREKGIEVTLFDASTTHVSYMVSAAFQWSHLVLASVSYNAGLFPPVRILVDELVARNFQNRTVALIENGTWCSTSNRLICDKFEKSKNINIIESSVSIKSSLKEENLFQIEAMSKEIAATVKP